MNCRPAPVPSAPIRAARGTALLAALFMMMAGLGGISGAGCRLPGPRSMEVTAEKPSALLDRCAGAIRAMHFDVKAVDRSHLVVVGEGKIEGGLHFHPVHLSIKVVHLDATRYRVEATATSDEDGIRAGAEKKAREMFFRKLEERGGRAG